MEFPQYDILIIGCGPAGLSAAINTTIRNKKTKVFGGDFCSPKLHRAPHINNYLGFWDITGEELRQRYLKHVQQLKIEIQNQRIDTIYPVGDVFNVVSKGNMIICKAVIIAVACKILSFFPAKKNCWGKVSVIVLPVTDPCIKEKKLL